jgi:putative addiction module component (TIGR02574 family)
MQPILLDRLRTEALQLSDSDRAELASSLWSSVKDPAVIEQAWHREIERRVADLDAGRTTAIKASTVFEEAKRIVTTYK